MRTPLSTSRRKIFALVSTVAALAGILTACTTAGSNSAAHSCESPSEGVKAARDATAAAAAFPTDIPQQTPLKEKPEPGRTFVYLDAGTETAATTRKAVQVAAQAIGWTVKVIPYQTADPSTLISAMDQSLQYRPVGVAFSALPYAVWSAEVSKFEAAGVPLIPNSTGPVPTSNSVPFVIQNGDDQKRQGEMLANWLIGDSCGTAKALVYSVSGYPVLKQLSDPLHALVAQRCPKCEIIDLNVTIPEVQQGKSLDAIVTAVQKQPDIGYVLTTVGPQTNGLRSALRAAGVGANIKIAGASAAIQQATEVKQGQAAAFTGYSADYTGWNTIDVAARLAQGMPIDPQQSAMITGLLTPENMKDQVANSSYNYPADFPERLKKLWKVGDHQ